MHVWFHVCLLDPSDPALIKTYDYYYLYCFKEEVAIIKMSIEVRSSEELRMIRGCLAVVCDSLDALAHQSLSQITIPAQYLQNRERPDNSLQFHMTLLTAKEVKRLSTCKHVDLLQEFKESLVGQKWLPLGIGNRGECHFIVVIFPHAAAMRRKFGLPHLYFHITLGFPTGGWLGPS
jgi:hypothetical protein